MQTQIQSTDISQSAVRFITEEVLSSGSTTRSFEISYNPISFTNTMSHSTITALTAGMSPIGLAEINGDIYFSETDTIRKITPSGTIELVAGQDGSYGFSGDGGPAISGVFARPKSIASDNAGNLYIADSNNYRVRMIDTNGIISTVAGNGSQSFSGEGNGGPAISGSISNSFSVGAGPSGVFYICDTNAQQFRKVQNGIIDLIAGSGISATYPGDGQPAIGWLISSPSSICADTIGNFYFTDENSQLFIKVNSSGLMTKIAGIENSPGYNGENILASGAQLYYPYTSAVDASGNLYVADGQNGTNIRIRMIDTNGIIHNFVGNGSNGFSGDGGQASGATYHPSTTISNSSEFIMSSDANFYLVDGQNYRIRVVDPSGIIQTFAGYGNPNYTQGEYVVNTLYVPPIFIDSVIQGTTGLARYTNLSGISMQVNLSNLTGFSPLSIDKFYISYTTNE